jgi:hypothetical protein
LHAIDHEASLGVGGPSRGHGDVGGQVYKSCGPFQEMMRNRILFLTMVGQFLSKKPIWVFDHGGQVFRSQNLFSYENREDASRQRMQATDTTKLFTTKLTRLTLFKPRGYLFFILRPMTGQDRN